jgi:hypothetical protein
MKLTQNGFRLRCALGFVLLGLVLLPMVDWHYYRELFTSPLGTWRHTGYWERRQKGYFPAAAATLIFFGGMLCFEFAGDPPPRKDPWETEAPPEE